MRMINCGRSRQWVRLIVVNALLLGLLSGRVAAQAVAMVTDVSGNITAQRR